MSGRKRRKTGRVPRAATEIYDHLRAARDHLLEVQWLETDKYDRAELRPTLNALHEIVQGIERRFHAIRTKYDIREE